MFSRLLLEVTQQLLTAKDHFTYGALEFHSALSQGLLRYPRTMILLMKSLLYRLEMIMV
jgi:hypothetical protein